jgi:rare lipoprotein A
MLLAVLTAVVAASGCGKKRATVNLPPPMKSVKKGYTEEGIASWYGHPYHGRKTSNGETYDMDRLTAAHKTLPFGVWVVVENKRNKKTVDVRINDRGPFVDGRIIDLSRAAARKIDMIGPGTAPVRIKVIRVP